MTLETYWKVSGVSESANDDIGDILKGKVLIRVPEVIKGKKKEKNRCIRK